MGRGCVGGGPLLLTRSSWCDTAGMFKVPSVPSTGTLGTNISGATTADEEEGEEEEQQAQEPSVGGGCSGMRHRPWRGCAGSGAGRQAGQAGWRCRHGNTLPHISHPATAVRTHCCHVLNPWPFTCWARCLLAEHAAPRCPPESAHQAAHPLCWQAQARTPMVVQCTMYPPLQQTNKQTKHALPPALPPVITGAAGAQRCRDPPQAAHQADELGGGGVEQEVEGQGAGGSAE